MSDGLFNEHEKRLVALWDKFVEVSMGILTGELSEDEQPSAAKLREMRQFLEKNEVNLHFRARDVQTPGPRGRMRSMGPVPFPREDAGGA